jgi:DNA mismatch endonuclease (patch repair protein)
MSRIRSKDTKPELLVRSYLHARGLRYRLHAQELPGRPDLVFPKYNVAVFIHGCFWHAHSCQKGRIPGTRAKFWKAKFDANKSRDRRNERALRRAGWRVLQAWECKLSNPKTRVRTLVSLERRIRLTPRER